MPIVLSLVIPCGPGDDAALERLLRSLQGQTFPPEQLEVLLIREGTSEEAKAIGISRAHGEIIGLLCTDNELNHPGFLDALVDAARAPGVVGAYPYRYTYQSTDPPLTRYFALLGANDPVCWWLGKADREGYFTRSVTPDEGFWPTWPVSFPDRIPSLGDNGFFLKRELAQRVVHDPATFGSCMDMCEDLRRLGLFTYTVVGTTIGHRTGDSWRTYLSKRWRYVRELYWQALPTRRWRMVAGWRDWLGVCGFALASIALLPQGLVAVYGYGRLRDRAWGLHLLVCLSLVVVYGAAWLEHLMRQWWSVLWSGHKSWRPVSPASSPKQEG